MGEPPWPRVAPLRPVGAAAGCAPPVEGEPAPVLREAPAC